MRWIWAQLLRWLQSFCTHHGDGVTYDVMEGDGNGTIVQWCRRCGAYRVHHDVLDGRGAMTNKAFTEPHPEWWA